VVAPVDQDDLGFRVPQGVRRRKPGNAEVIFIGRSPAADTQPNWARSATALFQPRKSVAIVGARTAMWRKRAYMTDTVHQGALLPLWVNLVILTAYR